MFSGRANLLLIKAGTVVILDDCSSFIGMFIIGDRT